MVWGTREENWGDLICTRFSRRIGRPWVDRSGLQILRQLARRIARAAGLRDDHDLPGAVPAPPNGGVRYSWSVTNAASAQRSPTNGMLLGLVITLAAAALITANRARRWR